MSHTITVLKIEHLTPDVLRIVTNKPEGYIFQPGQATNMAINKDGTYEKKRPFTFTSLPDEEELEFTIKMYPTHDGVTDELSDLKVAETLLIGDAWGAIEHQGEGTFIAGGAGITPFISIFKDLHRKGKIHGHQLFFGNKTNKDIIYKQLLDAWLGEHVVHVLSDEDHDAYIHGHIDKELLEAHDLDISKKVYLCGPPPMMESLQADLYSMGLSKDQLIAEDLA